MHELWRQCEPFQPVVHRALCFSPLSSFSSFFSTPILSSLSPFSLNCISLISQALQVVINIVFCAVSLPSSFITIRKIGLAEGYGSRAAVEKSTGEASTEAGSEDGGEKDKVEV